MLSHNTALGQHAEQLYSTLSEVIHKYADGEYKVDRLNYSPIDADILTALIPQREVVKDVKSPEKEIEIQETTKSQFRRYIWDPTAGLTTATNDASITEDGLKRCAEKQKQDVQRRSSNLLPTEPLDCWSYEVLSERDKRFIVRKFHRPVADDIDSSGFLKGVVLAALIESAGRFALAPLYADHEIGRSELSFNNLKSIKHVDSLSMKALLKAKSRATEKTSHDWTINIDFLPDDDATKLPVATGTFQAWQVEQEDMHTAEKKGKKEDPATSKKKGKKGKSEAVT